jgi:SAM-dependent methyltransferase
MKDSEEFKRWQEIHQPFELKYHQQGNFRWPSREPLWDEQWENVFSLFGELKKDSFSDSDVLLDVGCGSRPALQWFNCGQKYNIDPLLDEFLKIKQLYHHWENFDEKFLISSPAEELQPDLINQCDFVLCWNVLDHTFDWKKILHNCWEYLKNDGIFLLGTDHGGKEHIGHPGIPNSKEFFDEIERWFYKQKYSKAGFKRCRTSAFLLKKK